METNENVVNFNFKVEHDNPVSMMFRKKERTKCAILFLIVSLLFVLFTVLSSMAKNSSIWVSMIFGGFALVGVLTSLYYFATRNGTTKDANKETVFTFAEDLFVVSQYDKSRNKQKDLTKALYSSYGNKQFISNVIENNDYYEIKVFTGTLNGVPQFKRYVLPKNVIGSDKIEVFKAFIFERVGKNYKVKN